MTQMADSMTSEAESTTQVLDSTPNETTSTIFLSQTCVELPFIDDGIERPSERKVIQMQKRQAQLQQLVEGTQKDLPATSTVVVDGQVMKQADIVAKLQGWIQLFQQVDATKAPSRSAQQALQAAVPEMHQFMVLYGQALKTNLGKSSPLLADFGLATTQRKVPTSETRVLAKARAASTREARQTMGKVQKKAVKGTPVTTVMVSANSPRTAQTPSSQVVNPVASASEPAVPETSAGVVPAGSSVNGK